MGVHGLTTYLREHRTNIAKSLHFRYDEDTLKSPVPFVIDGWS